MFLAILLGGVLVVAAATIATGKSPIHKNPENLHWDIPKTGPLSDGIYILSENCAGKCRNLIRDRARENPNLNFYEAPLAFRKNRFRFLTSNSATIVVLSPRRKPKTFETKGDLTPDDFDLFDAQLSKAIAYAEKG